MYYIQITFRCMTPDQIGIAQHLMADKEQSVASVAKRYKVSVATMYRIKKAIPAHLVSVRQTRRKAS